MSGCCFLFLPARWNERYIEAKLSMEDRAAKLDAVAEEIEQGLILLGCTAIEDKLQEGVPHTIKTLAEAGIRLWVLTGDKMVRRRGVWVCTAAGVASDAVTWQVQTIELAVCCNTVTVVTGPFHVSAWTVRAWHWAAVMTAMPMRLWPFMRCLLREGSAVSHHFSCIPAGDCHQHRLRLQPDHRRHDPVPDAGGVHRGGQAGG